MAAMLEVRKNKNFLKIKFISQRKIVLLFCAYNMPAVKASR